MHNPTIITNHSNACNVLDSSRCMRYQITSRSSPSMHKHIVCKISHPVLHLDINIRHHHHQSCMHEHMTRLNAYVHTNNITTSSQHICIYEFINNSPSLDIYAITNTITIQLTYMCLPTTTQSTNIYAFTNINFFKIHQDSLGVFSS